MVELEVLPVQAMTALCRPVACVDGSRLLASTGVLSPSPTKVNWQVSWPVVFSAGEVPASTRLTRASGLVMLAATKAAVRCAEGAGAEAVMLVLVALVVAAAEQ